MNPPPRRGSFGREVIVSVAFTVAMTILATGNSVAIARLSGPTGRGMYALLVAILAVSHPLVTLGLGPAITFALGRKHDAGAVWTLGMMWIGLATAISLLGATIWYFTASIWLTGSTVAVVLAAFVGTGPAIAVDFAASIYLGLRRVIAYNLVQTTQISILLVLNVMLLSRGTEFTLINYLIASSTVAVCAMIAVGLRCRPLKRPDASLRKTCRDYGPQAAMTQLGEVALLRLDYVVMTPLLTLDLIGLYAVADNITHVMAWGALIAGKMMFVQSAHDTEGSASRKRLGIVVRLLIPINILIALFAALIGPWLLPALFGEPFAASYVGLLILLPATMLKSLVAMFGTYLSGQDRQRTVVHAAVIAVILDVILILVLVPTVGWYGAAIAKSAAYFAQLIVVARAYVKQLPEDEVMQWMLKREDVAFIADWVTRNVRQLRGRGPAN